MLRGPDGSWIVAMPCVSHCLSKAYCRIPEFGLFKNPNCAYFWGFPDYFENILIPQVPIFEDSRVSGRVWHREPFSLWVPFFYLVLFFLGLFPPPGVEDGFNLSLICDVGSI